MFTRRQRTEILIESAPKLAKELADSIQKDYSVRILKEPSQVLVMNKVRESAKNTLFYLGEAVATEAVVELEGVRGLGIVLGTKDELALNLAIIDAAYTHPEIQKTLESFEAKLEHAQQELLAQKADRQKLYQASQVQFETMEEEL